MIEDRNKKITYTCPACGIPLRDHKKKPTTVHSKPVRGKGIKVPNFQGVGGTRGATDRDVSLPNGLSHLAASPPYRNGSITSDNFYTGI